MDSGLIRSGANSTETSVDADDPREGSVEAGKMALEHANRRGFPMLTRDAATQKAIADAISAARLGVPLLIQGETGTGKELLLRVAASASQISSEPVVVNCSAADAPTQFDPDAGAILLDNIDELSHSAQERMREAMRSTRSSDGHGPRYLAVSTRSLVAMVERGSFDAGLYREVAQLVVVIPSLRERRGDIVLLARHFICGRTIGFTADALGALSEYPFPGNVRELNNLVRRLSIVPLHDGGRSICGWDVRNQIMVAARQRADGPRSSWQSCVEMAHREIAARSTAAASGESLAAPLRLGILQYRREGAAGLPRVRSSRR